LRKKAKSLKKPLLYILFILIGIIVGIVISNVLYVTTGYSLFGHPADKPTSAKDIDNADLAMLAYSVLEHISDGNYTALSRVAHPEYGIVFSPYATVSLATNKCFQTKQIAEFSADNKLYVWGVNEVTGEPIEMTPEDYFAQYVLARDYIN